MDLDAIAVFVKVVEAGSFSGAARLLAMPKTTVSAKVAALEKRLGATLIQRTTRKLHITDAGAQYFGHCVKAVREIELGEAALVSTKAAPSGLLRITAPVDLVHTVLPRITLAYLQAYPGTRVELLPSNRVFDLLGEGIDLAIRVGARKDSTLITRRFLNLRMCLWATPSYLAKAPRVRRPADLARHPLYGHAAMKATYMSKGTAREQLQVESRLVSEDFETIKAMVLLGEGIGWMPDFLAADAVAAGTLLPVLPEWTTRSAGDFFFVYPGSRYTSPKVQAFMRLAIEMANPA